ncbi:hypothetical protein COT95_00020, partial [Candidatus Falkowbacteria bacterium CG10_big_fil_rev_8_21_14_0_10_37_6]
MLPFSRFITVLIGGLCIYLIFRITNKLFKNRNISLLAALLLASSLMFVQMSHFARVWVPQVFFILLVFNHLAGMLEKEKLSLKDHIISGILISCSFAVHTIGVIVYFSYLGLLLLRRRQENITAIIKNKYFWLTNLIIILSVPIIYLLNPYAFYNYGSYFAAVADQGVATSGRSFHSLFGAAYYAQILFEYEPLLLLVFLLGVGVLYLQKRKVFYLLMSFIVSYYFFIGFIIGSDHSEPRYILPVIPFLAIISAYGIYKFIDSGRLNKKVKIIFVMIFLAGNLVMPVIWCAKIIKPATRLLAMDWIYKNINSGDSIINFDPYLTLNENRLSIEDKQRF